MKSHLIGGFAAMAQRISLRFFLLSAELLLAVLGYMPCTLYRIYSSTCKGRGRGCIGHRGKCNGSAYGCARALRSYRTYVPAVARIRRFVSLKLRLNVPFDVSRFEYDASPTRATSVAASPVWGSYSYCVLRSTLQLVQCKHVCNEARRAAV